MTKSYDLKEAFKYQIIEYAILAIINRNEAVNKKSLYEYIRNNSQDQAPALSKTLTKIRDKHRLIDEHVDVVSMPDGKTKTVVYYTLSEKGAKLYLQMKQALSELDSNAT